MANEEALREKYSVMETAALSTLWREEERMPWAEAILREALLERGIAAAELDDIAARREEIERNAPPKVRDTLFGWGILGRAVAAFLATSAAQVLGGLFGTKAALVGATFVIVAYATILVVRVASQMRHRPGAVAGFAMMWQCFEASMIALALLGATAWLLLADPQAKRTAPVKDESSLMDGRD